MREEMKHNGETENENENQIMYVKFSTGDQMLYNLDNHDEWIAVSERKVYR